MPEIAPKSDISKAWLMIFVSWVVCLMGTLGSLFFSEVMNYPPCAFCWYQRICLYPLVAILAAGFLMRDRKVGVYAWPFVGLGLVIAGYHNLLYYGVIPESLSPCTQGLSCKTVQWEWGFLSIPLLSLVGFVILAILLYLFSCNQKRETT